MGSHQSFQHMDRQGAELFAASAKKMGVKKIIYLGGLGSGKKLSDHLKSRQEVGEILRRSGVPTLELRSSIIIGSGSLSFELIRALVERLPAMTTPKWVRTKTQPIAVEDIISYLLEALELPLHESRIYEVGGPDRVSYSDLLKEYARQRGLRRLIIPVPILSPGLSSLWLGLVTPIYSRVGRKLISSVQNETIVRDDSALRDFTIRPMSIVEAISRALKNEDQEFAETRWADSVSSAMSPAAFAQAASGTRKIDTQVVTIPCAAAKVFAVIQQIGGDKGWYFADWLWKIRGYLDLLVGGVGMRRGRPHPKLLSPGDTLDFWRVEKVEMNRLIRLRAEMKLPGRAWLQFEVNGDSSTSELRQTAIFDPKGLAGRLYWYALLPIHKIIFRKMLQAIAMEIHRETLVTSS
jgi:uncharacterized protein YbjT (DUF2867 family)